MSTNNLGFYEDLTKIIFQLSSNTHLISSVVIVMKRALAHWNQEMECVPSELLET